MSETTSKIESWAIIEFFGHKKMAGIATTENFGPSVMLRVDIPETPRQPAFTQYYGMSSIYCLSPVTEEAARKTAESLNVAPPIPYELGAAIDKAFYEGKKSVLALAEKPKEPIITGSEDNY